MVEHTRDIYELANQIETVKQICCRDPTTTRQSKAEEIRQVPITRRFRCKLQRWLNSTTAPTSLKALVCSRLVWIQLWQSVLKPGPKQHRLERWLSNIPQVSWIGKYDYSNSVPYATTLMLKIGSGLEASKS